ncbi:Uncharacterised protein [Mycobacteroides abscessus subsp. abscessus]|nr:Uncharacterised protein [Mycobacteroides abscessus subsp. abscessus]
MHLGHHTRRGELLGKCDGVRLQEFILRGNEQCGRVRLDRHGNHATLSGEFHWPPVELGGQLPQFALGQVRVVAAGTGRIGSQVQIQQRRITHIGNRFRQPMGVCVFDDLAAQVPTGRVADDNHARVVLE